MEMDGVQNKNWWTCNNILIGINVIVFLGMSLFGMTEDAEFMLQHGAMYAPYVVEGHEYYRLCTCMFMHFGFAHLVNNMLVLFIVGQYLEEELGTIKYLVVYMAAGLGANILSLCYDVYTGNYAVSAGASGAIFGIIGAMLYVVIRNRGQVGTLTSRGLIIMIALSLYLGFTSTGVDNLAHIGGLVTGFIMAMLVYRKRRKRYSEYSSFT